jgi:hypothetical protein
MLTLLMLYSLCKEEILIVIEQKNGNSQEVFSAKSQISSICLAVDRFITKLRYVRYTQHQPPSVLDCRKEILHSLSAK